jgi:hypothetical protein
VRAAFRVTIVSTALTKVILRRAAAPTKNLVGRSAAGLLFQQSLHLLVDAVAYLPKLLDLSPPATVAQ